MAMVYSSTTLTSVRWTTAMTNVGWSEWPKSKAPWSAMVRFSGTDAWWRCTVHGGSSAWQRYREHVGEDYVGGAR